MHDRMLRFLQPADRRRFSELSQDLSATLRSWAQGIGLCWCLHSGWLLPLIFSFHQFSELECLARVCRTWRAACIHPTTLQALQLSFADDQQMRQVMRLLCKAAKRHHVSALPQNSASPLLIQRHFVMQSPSQGAPSSPLEIWLLQSRQQRLECAQALCDFIVNHKDLFLHQNIIQMNAGTGFAGLFASRFAKAMTLTDDSNLCCRMIRMNAFALEGCSPSLRWLGTSRQLVISSEHQPGLRVPVYIYRMSTSAQGAKAFQRQWQRDSGSAMRGLSHGQFPSVQFDVGLQCLDSNIDALKVLEAASALIADGGLFIVAGRHRDPPFRSLLSELDATGFHLYMHAAQAAAVQVLVLRKS